MALPVYQAHAPACQHMAFAGAFKFASTSSIEGTAISEVLSSGWKAATNPPHHNSMQKELDKIDWAGEQRVSNVSLRLQTKGNNGTARGHIELHLHTFRVISNTFLLILSSAWVLSFIARNERGDQSHRDSALVGYLNKHQGSLECRLRAQSLSVVLNKDTQV